jgi:hypothetical protein
MFLLRTRTLGRCCGTGTAALPASASSGWSLIAIKGRPVKKKQNTAAIVSQSPTTHLAVGIVTNVRVHDGKGNRLEGDQYEKTERGDEVVQRPVMAHAPKDKNPDPDQPRQH